MHRILVTFIVYMLVMHGAQAEALQPDNLEMKYWHAVSLVNAGRLDAAAPVFTGIFRKDERWHELLPRLVKAVLLDADEMVLGRINAAASKQGEGIND